MLFKFKYFLVAVFFLLTLNLKSIEPTTPTLANIRFNEDYKLSEVLLDDLNVRIYQLDIDSTQLNFFKDQLELEKTLFDNYLKESNQKIQFSEQKLDYFENGQVNATVENIKKGIALYSKEKKLIQKYKLRINKIEKIHQKINDLLFEIVNHHVRFGDIEAEKKYKENCTLANDLINDLNIRINTSGLDREQLDFFKTQLLMLRKLFELHLQRIKHKISFWDIMLFDFERNQSNSTLENMQKGINIYSERKRHLEKYKITTVQIKVFLERINHLLYLIVNRRVKVSDRLLFSSEGKFYDPKVWGLAINDISFRTNKLIDDTKNSILKNMNTPWAKFWLAVLVLYAICLRWINRLSIKLTHYLLHDKLDAKMDLKYYYQLIRICLYSDLFQPI